MEQVERRIGLGDIEVRADDEGQPQTLVGYAAMFDSLSDNLGGFREKIAPGAFSESLSESPDVRALWNHDPNFVLGRTRSETLTVAEDDQGLRTEITPPDAAWARDLLVSVARRDVTQMSFGFMVRAGGDSWDEDEEGRIIRTLTNVSLFDVSPVTFPAYPDTTVAQRALEQWKRQRPNHAPKRAKMLKGFHDRGLRKDAR